MSTKRSNDERAAKRTAYNNNSSKLEACIIDFSASAEAFKPGYDLAKYADVSVTRASFGSLDAAARDVVVRLMPPSSASSSTTTSSSMYAGLTHGLHTRALATELKAALRARDVDTLCRLHKEGLYQRMWASLLENFKFTPKGPTSSGISIGSFVPATSADQLRTLLTAFFAEGGAADVLVCPVDDPIGNTLGGAAVAECYSITHVKELCAARADVDCVNSMSSLATDGELGCKAIIFSAAYVWRVAAGGSFTRRQHRGGSDSPGDEGSLSTVDGPEQDSEDGPSDGSAGGAPKRARSS